MRIPGIITARTAPWCSIKHLVRLLLCPVFLACTASASEIENGFESGTLAGWGTSRLPNQKTSATIELLPGDAPIFNGYRAELDDPLMAQPGSEAWYGFSLYIPTPRSKLDRGCTIAQFHDQSSVQVPGQFSNGAHSPPLAFRYSGHDLKITTENTVPLPGVETPHKEIARIRNFTLDRWHDIRVHVIWNPIQGLVEIWDREGINGTEQLVASYTGGVGLPPTPTDVGPYFKVGPYCGEYSPPQGLVIYIDNYTRQVHPWSPGARRMQP